MHRYVLALGGAGLLLSVSAIAALSAEVRPTTPPDPPKFEAQQLPNFVSIGDILEYKALPAYHEPDWVTKNFVDKGKLPPVKDRLPKEPVVFKTANATDGIGTYGDVMRHVIGGRRRGGTSRPGRSKAGAASISACSNA